MSMGRTSRLVGVLLLGASLWPSAAGAQGTVKVDFAINIPIAVANLHSSLTYVRPECEFSQGSTPLTSQPAPSPPSATGRAAYGQTAVSSLPKTVTVHYSVTVPNDAGGQTGSYTCYLRGSLTADSPEQILDSDAMNSPAPFRLAPNSPWTVTGTFVF